MKNEKRDIIKQAMNRALREGKKDKSYDAEFQRFLKDVARVAEHNEHYLLIVSSDRGRLFWKSNNSTWALGAMERYKTTRDELDRIDERIQQEGPED